MNLRPLHKLGRLPSEQLLGCLIWAPVIIATAYVGRLCPVTRGPLRELERAAMRWCPDFWASSSAGRAPEGWGHAIVLPEDAT